MELLVIADWIQILILITLIITAWFALKAINETKNIHKETLLWNKKNKTIDVLNDFRKVRPEKAKLIFNYHSVGPNETISLKAILNAINEDPEIGSEIVEYLNHFEGIALGVKNELYDEKLVKKARGETFYQTWVQYHEYIYHRREISNPKAWDKFEEILKDWKKLD